MSKTISDFNDAINSVCREINAPRNFLTNLLKEEDWSLIVKAHVLIESAVTYLLTKKIGKPSLEDTFARLELSNNTTGKLAFIKGLNLLEKRHRRFIKILSEIRNHLVHNIKNINFSLCNYIKSEPPVKRNNIVEAISACWGSPLEINDIKIEPKKFAEKNPKWGILFSTMELLSAIYVEKELATVEMATQRIYKEFFNRHTDVQQKNNHTNSPE